MIESLHSQRLILQKINHKHVENIYQAIRLSYEDISPWASWLHPNYKVKDAQAYVQQQMTNWQKDEEYAYVIKSTTGDLLGMINLHVFDRVNGVANIGYWMSSQYTCRGYCSEAVMAVLEQAFVQLNLIRVELIIGINNMASQKVAHKCGAAFEGVLKNRIRPSGIPCDARMYAFTKSY